MAEYSAHVRRWDVFEVSLEGPSDGNPFTEQWLSGIFTGRNESVVTEGFYDGDGIYRIRFMPSYEGKYTFVIRTSFSDACSGVFYVEPAQENCHGPVRTCSTYHFAYEDGTPFYPLGTTAYVWHLQTDEMIKKTLASLEQSSFNKIRFCIFPKHYAYNLKEPREYPYEGTPMDSSVLNDQNFFAYLGRDEGNSFDKTRFRPSYFRHIENMIRELGRRGIEADLICMHPYDRWGFSSMSREEDDLYWKYIISRFSAFRNVWWALANEYDLLKAKTEADWEHYADLLVRRDPYHHLRSIHNCTRMYDHSRPWITHCSVQRIDLYKGAELTDDLRMRYGKPVVMDEIAYEGNLPYGFGNITPEEMTRRFWETAVRGGYPGHGETYLDDEAIWWSHGGTLHGESWKRMGFLLQILKEVPGCGLMPIADQWDDVAAVPESEWSLPVRSQYLFYYSFMRPAYREFHIDDETEFAADIIDTWNMTITKAGVHKGAFRIDLPQRQYMAIRLRRPEEADYVSDTEEEPEQEPELAVPDITLIEPEEPAMEQVPETAAEPEEAFAPVLLEDYVTEEPQRQEELPAEEEDEPADFDTDDELPEIVGGGEEPFYRRDLENLAVEDISLEDTADLDELEETLERTLNIPKLRFHRN